MRQLIIIRHAKSDWGDAGLPDHDRPLNPRGLRDAPVMGQRLNSWCPKPVSLLTSTALRARTTAEIIAGEIGLPRDQLQQDSRLYGASGAGLITYLQSLADEQAAVILVGHNPGVTDLVNQLCPQPVDSLPTCGIVHLQLQIDRWPELATGCGEQVLFDYPKKPV